MLREEHRDRLDHLVISTLPDLLTTIVSDRSVILFIEYHPAWFGVDRSDLKMKFNEVCRQRAQKGGPVVIIIAVMDRGLLALDGKTDYFFQIGKNSKKTLIKIRFSEESGVLL
jgi:hypothetical protein